MSDTTMPVTECKHRQQLSQIAQATQSATAAMRLNGDARRAALLRHFEHFAPNLARMVCRARKA
jgi:hypothetical protein